jgi:hypothetical protein
MKKHVRMSLLLVTCVALLVGCSSFQGLNVQKMVYDADLKSYEGKARIVITSDYEMPKVMTDDLLDAKARQEVMRSLEIDLQQIRVQDRTTISWKGTIKIPQGTIPFHLSMNKGQIWLTAEGLLQPMRVHSFEMDEDSPLNLLGADVQSVMLGQLPRLLGPLTSFLGGKLSLPDTTTVTAETIALRDETLDSKKVTAKWQGTALATQLKTSLQAAADDSKGLRQLSNEWFDVLIPTIQSGESGAKPDPLMTALIGNKSLASGYLATTLGTMLTDWSKSLSSLDANGMNLSIESYADSASNLRKLKANFRYAPALPPTAGEPLKEAKLRTMAVDFELERWNLNGVVSADVLTTPAKALILNESFQGPDMLKQMDKKSVPYRVARYHFKWGRKTIDLPLDVKAKTIAANAPYVSKNVTMVPLRFVSQELQAQVNFNGQKRLIEIVDDGTRIQMTMNNKVVYVNGAKRTISAPAVMQKGTTYVPGRVVSEMLGAKVKWIPEEKLVRIIRD